MAFSVQPQPAPPTLTLLIQCSGSAWGLHDTLESLRVSAANAELQPAVRLLPWQLNAQGTEALTAACANAANGPWWVPPEPCANPAEALAQACQEANTAWIWWLEAGDRLQPQALQQWRKASLEHPDALLIAGDGEQLNSNGTVIRRHGAPAPSMRLRQLMQEQLYCPGGFCIQRRLLAIVPLPPAPSLRWSYRETWLLSALEQCRDRVAVIPELWVQTHQLCDGHTPGRCRRRALELSQHLAQRWGTAPGGLLHRYGLQLQQGEATVPEGSTALEELATALEVARPWLDADTWQRLQLGWGLDPQAAPWQQQLEERLQNAGLEQLWCVTLLRNLLHPELGALQLGSPWGPNLRCAERLLSAELWCQYRLLRQDAELLATLNQPLEGIPLVGILHWQHSPDLQRQFPLPKARERYSQWWSSHAGNAIPHVRFNGKGEIEAQPFSEELPLHPDQRPFGVNLIGHAFEVFGIGEDVRMAALALESAEVPFCVVNVPANNGAAASDRSLEARTLPEGQLGPYCFNLVCLAAPSHGAWIAREGLAQQRGRTTIVAWPWETQTWPKAWECMIPLADVLWPSSTFTAKALEPFADHLQRPLQVMPMAVHIDQPEQYRIPAQRQHTRAQWGLDLEARLVLFAFDVKSTLARKNPWGAIQAFQQAFPQNHPTNVQLVIKALRPGSTNQHWKKLQHHAARDPRLKVIEADLKRTELLALMGASDIFLSLHRSEGFGRGIAEAGILGLQVVASDWGGNTDFCQGDSFHLIPCTPTTISAGTYPLAEGHIWGEPNLDAASKALQRAASTTSNLTNLNPRLQALSTHNTGQRYKAYLRDTANPVPTFTQKIQQPSPTSRAETKPRQAAQ